MARGLVLMFVPNVAQTVAEFARVGVVRRVLSVGPHEPFLGGTGAAPAATLPAEQLAAVRDLLRSRLPGKGPIELTAKAWAVRGAR